MNKVRIGLIDSGVAVSTATASRSFLPAPGGSVFTEDAFADRLGHGTAMAEVLLASTPDCELFNAQVFTGQLTCSAVQVSTALLWLVEQKVNLVNMSFGLREDRPVLRDACELALDKGVILIAAAPARGEPVFPSSYPGVIRATGDARCADDEISYLDTPKADYGANVCSGKNGVAGASVGCAHVSARVAQYLAKSPGASHEQVRVWLSSMASFRGPERRAG